MKRLLLLALLFFFLSTLPSSSNAANFNDIPKNTEDLYRAGSGTQSGKYAALSSSMIAWGLGLAAGIAILASVLHQSTSGENAHSHCH